MPVVAALLLTASCSSEDNEIVEAPLSAQTRTVPFTVTVNSGSQTRATVDNWTNKYMFETTDKLWVWNDDGKIYGELEWQDGKYGYTYDGTFSGNLTVEAGATLEASTTLYATIKSSSDEILGANLAAFKANNFLPDYTSATTYASSNAEAVQKFSFFKATSTYGAKSFNFSDTQNSTFLSFDITLEDGTDDNTNVSVYIYNGISDLVRTGSVTTEADGSGNVHAKFVAGFPSGTTLSSASVKVGTSDNISFGASQTLAANKIYNVTRTYTRYKITASATIPTTIANTLHISENQSMTTSNKPMNYTTTLQDMLDAMGTEAAMIKTMVSGCTRTSPASDWSVDYSDLGGTPKNYQFEVVGVGETVFNMSVTYGVTVNVPITINVEKMTPAD